MAYYLSKNSGYIGEVVEITGENLGYDFTSGTKVYFHNNIEAVVELISTTVIRTTIPEGATSGMIVISNYRNLFRREVSNIMPDMSTDTSVNSVTPIINTLQLLVNNNMPSISIETIVE